MDTSDVIWGRLITLTPGGIILSPLRNSDASNNFFALRNMLLKACCIYTTKLGSMCIFYRSMLHACTNMTLFYTMVM